MMDRYVKLKILDIVVMCDDVFVLCIILMFVDIVVFVVKVCVVLLLLFGVWV